MSEHDRSGRDAILGTIRRALGRETLSPEARAACEARLANPKPNLIPARAKLPHAEQVALFIKMAEAVQASVVRVARDEQVPAAVTEYLKSQNLPSDVVMAPDPALDRYGWHQAPMLTVRRGKPVDQDQVGVTGALIGVAETGTLMMVSGPDHPTTLNFMPETHVVVLRAEQVRGSYEEGFALLRTRAEGKAPDFMPRTVNFITGPSRTGDIEQKIELGAHGPRRLHIVVVGD
jgi:L-lactate dehydrogenase complex protein LldG